MTDLNQPREGSSIPTVSTGDRAHALVRGAVSGIPIAGGVLAEVFGMILVAPLERRCERWMQDVADRLKALEERDPARFSALPNDDTFTTVLLQATQASSRAHTEEKRVLLRNAVMRSAGGVDLEADLQVTFVRYLDELLPSHVALLSAVSSNERDVAYVKSWEDLYSKVASDVGGSLTRERFRLLMGDLNTRVLLRVNDLLEEFPELGQGPTILTTEESGNAMVRVTTLGRQFLAFVASEADNRAA
jgi:hypothetical protein